MIQPAETIKRGTHTLRSPSKVLMHMTRITAMTAVITSKVLTLTMSKVFLKELVIVVPPHSECL